MKNILSLYLLGLCTLSTGVKFKKSIMPKFTDTDMIELHHLRSFALLAAMSDAGSFKLQTSGIALRSTETNSIIVLEFKPLNISSCFLPIVTRTPKNAQSTQKADYARNVPESSVGNNIPDSNTDSKIGSNGDNSVGTDSIFDKNSTLTWDKRSTVSYETSIDPKYWMQSTFLGIINGVVYRNYLNWVEDYLEKVPGKYFIPQSICSSAEEESCFTLPSTGDTFLAKR